MSVLMVVLGIPHPERTEILKQYQSAAGAVIRKHAGQIVARGSGIESLVGHHKWSIGVIVRFPDIQAVRDWYNDPDYQKVIPLRTQAYSEIEISVFQE